jgi:hypothetical protein
VIGVGTREEVARGADHPVHGHDARHAFDASVRGERAQPIAKPQCASAARRPDLDHDVGAGLPEEVLVHAQVLGELEQRDAHVRLPLQLAHAGAPQGTRVRLEVDGDRCR